VDELRSGLELATDEELQALSEILFRPGFNPLDYLNPPDLTALQSCSRRDWLDRVEQRFRYLAADGFTVLNGRSQMLSYRQVLLQICHYLKLPYGEDWSTADIEAEVFLHLVEVAWNKLPAKERQRLQQRLHRSLAQSPQFHELPLPIQHNPLGLLLKGTGVVAVNSVLRPWVLQQIARQIALNAARYEVAKQTMVRGGGIALAQIQNRVALSMASRGMAVNAARYGATRTVFAFLGPALWAWLLADLGWRAIATNYGRVIPVVFALAQIRLTRAADAFEAVSC
jgi:uncharacterized protein YaaW (UPF0174 family)